MVRLEQIDVEGFKGIESLQFEPGAINVVTGRNNSGKTSLLEAINIALQPDRIAGFGSHLRTVINSQYERARIVTKSPQNDVKLTLQGLPEEDIPELLLEAFRQEFINSWDAIGPNDVSEEFVVETVDSELSELLTEALSDVPLEDLNNELLALQINKERYPYVYYGTNIGDVHVEVLDQLDDAVRERHADQQDETADDRGALSNLTIHRAFRNPARGTFVGESPPSVGSVNFIDFVQLSENLDIPEDDADPVKIDNIGDFLRENDIVENLKTFDLDDLVFEDEDGEKYSVPFSFMGEGFKSIVGVLWELFDEEELEDVVLLEEPETHMHPGYVRKLIYFFIQVVEEADVQLFITTHNNDFLNDFFTENLTDDERRFLEEEFKLLQLQDGVADVMTYAEAEEQLKDLQLDLRGL